jgi:hypothetical protein
MDREETLMLLGCYVISWLALLLVAKKSKSGRRVVFVHLILQFGYSVFFWINLSLPNHGGVALAVIVGWFISLGLHVGIMMLQLIVTAFLRRPVR